ncbi:guanylate kinase 1-like [Phoenix dactylifera]|uniref:Guanylate kinase 1 n=1 Tax=Phoenix dactylifera TaxID=42345 RepID=A0A8B8J324_PHODC|nr:guanylate kinase 1-like [Phoenix dactylifera]XP_026659436.2 guanylate kinase 1-like [Phoenix dactylifera]XP_038978727.1 guanylate kinase 1-like [Phoenix dactylifera]XP_038978728.1 guanylate kinase 1-like [Phoenix dactylifera]
MGQEAPGNLLDIPDGLLSVGYDSESKGHQTATLVNDKIYVVEGSRDAAKLWIDVKIFDKSTGKWLIPTVLGTKPRPSNGHSAVPVNDDRILILKADCSADDCFWFLEVGSPYVKEQSKLLGAEVVAWSKGVVGEGPKPVVISGPSGVGKGTLISKLMKEFPTTFGFSVSHTTRAPREKEIDGVHYHFTERSTMEKEIRDGKFLESALVHGNLYGTSIEAVEAVAEAGKRCILDIDVQGARSVRSSSLEALFIFIRPPSFEELEKRLRSRRTETEEQVQKRLRNARAELEEGKSLGLFDHILVNDDLETCYENLKKLLMLDDGTNANYQPTVRSFEIPVSHSVSIKDQKILMRCGTSELGKAITSLFLLDVSSLKGGSPGQTRGLGVYAISSYAE